MAAVLQGLALEFEAVSAWVPGERRVLWAVGGRVAKGSVTAILGPSGSGKTTLLSLITGRRSHVVRWEGDVRVDGLPLSKEARRAVAFVAQHALLWPALTVRESLVAAALLRLPRGMCTPDKLARVDRAVEDLRLRDAQHTIIGDVARRGVSGGEQKRVAIAQELLTNPRLLALDEPTSGLDSATSASTVELLRGLARRGCTTLMSIHQPSSALFGSFDDVLVLSRGRVLFRGSPSSAADHLAGAGAPVPPCVSLAEHLVELAADEENDTLVEACPPPALDGAREAPADAISSNTVSRLPTILQRSASAPAWTASGKSSRWPATFSTQVRVLVWRNVRGRWGDAVCDPWKLGQLVFVAVFAGGLLWFQAGAADLTERGVLDIGGLLFFEAIFIGFMSLFTSMSTFIGSEMHVMKAERAAGWYRLSSFFVARCLADVPLELINPLVIVPIVYWLAGLRADAGAFFVHLLATVLGALVASSLGLAVGAATSSFKKAQTLSSSLMLAVMLAGGFYVQDVAPWISWVSYVSFINYVYSILLKVQFPPGATFEASADGSRHLVWESDGLLPPLVFPADGDGAALDAAVLVAMFVVLRLLAYALLRLRTRAPV